MKNRRPGPGRGGGDRKPRAATGGAAASGAPRGSGAAGQPSRGRRLPWLAGRGRTVAVASLLLLGVAAVTLALWSAGFPVRPAARAEFPPPPPPTATAAAEWTDFVGAEACAPCHTPQYDAWRASTHGRAGGPPSRERVLAAFDGTPIRFRDAVVIPSVGAAGEFRFTVRQEGLPERVLRADGVIGGGHMVGGGTQGFVSRESDGTYRFLPFDFARQEAVWFCNTSTRSDKGWIAITEEVALAECGDWPPVRVLGEIERYANCQSCHGSQIEVAYDTARKAYQTRFQSLAINCEACHGPGRRHVELARSGGIDASADIGMRALATLGKDASLEVCLACHAVKDAVRPGYLPGAPLSEHYSLRLPSIGERPLHPDGRVRTFAYQENHLFSDCYLNGSMTCVDCHDPHSQGYRDVAGRPLPGRFDDGQCLGCHASKAEPIERHTFHAAASAGSRCVACHMPYLQHPEVGGAIRFARSDHTIGIPRPALDRQLGIVGACQQCHVDIPIAGLQQQVESWYGELKPLPPLVAGLLRARSASDTNPVDANVAAELVLRPDDHHPAAQFAGVAFLLENHLHPDMPNLARETVRALQRLGESTDLDLRAVALAALHLARGEDRQVRGYLVERLRAAGADEAPLRARWALVLGYLGDAYRGRGSPGQAIATYAKALEVVPDDPRVLLNLGLAHAGAGELPEAVAFYRLALAADASQPLVLLNLGSALAAMGDPAGAVSAYRRAIELYPHDALPYLNLGNLLLRQRQPERAIEFYREAAQRNPGLAPAHFHLARAYILVGEYDRALAAVRQGLRFEPADPTALQMLRDLERALAGP